MDVIFEAISLVIVLVISLYSYKIFKITEEKRYKYFSLAFLLISGAFFFKISTNFTLYFNQMIYYSATSLVKIAWEVTRRSDIIYHIGYFLYRVLMLLGFFGIYVVLDKVKNKKQIILMIYLIFISALLGEMHYALFHLTAAIFLFFIAFIYYYKTYLKKKTKNTKYLSASFLTILLSQVIFIFIFLDLQLYVIGEVVQLIGYSLMLFTYMCVLRK